jgi:hypothetical protein
MRFRISIATLSLLSIIGSGASAQNRTLGANKLILDDGLGRTMTIQTPSPLPGPVGGNFIFSLPIPPAGNPPAGFVGIGTNPQTLYWNTGNAAWQATSVLSNDGVSAVGVTGNFNIANASGTGLTFNNTGVGNQDVIGTGNTWAITKVGRGSFGTNTVPYATNWLISQGADAAGVDAHQIIATSNGSVDLELGVSTFTANSFGTIQAISQGVGTIPLQLQPISGSVGINKGATVPAFTLDLNGSLGTSGAVTFSALNTLGVVHNSAAGLLSTSLVAPADLNAAGAVAGMSPTYNGAAVVWGNPQAATLVLPLSQTLSNPGTLFAITNTDGSTGNAATFANSNSGNLNTALRVTTNSLSSSAATVSVTNALGTGAALVVVNSGTGPAVRTLGTVQITSPTATPSTLDIQSASSGNFTSFKAQAQVGGTINYTLPAAPPTANGQVLASTAVAGNNATLTWSTPSAGSAPVLIINGVASGGGFYFVQPTDNVIGVNTTAGGPSIVLPSASTAGAGHTLIIKDIGYFAGTNNFTIFSNGAGQSFESDTPAQVTVANISTNGRTIRLFSDGVSKWYQW